MNRETVIISPELEPGSGGVADYTLRVVEQWPTGAPLRFILPNTHRSAPARLDATAVERSTASLLAALPLRDGAVLLQYSAYGFDQFGYPRWLLRALLEWKKRSRGLLAIMFHEIWTFWPVLNKNYFVQQLHRRDIRNLLVVTDAIFTSTPSQAEHLRQLAPERDVEVLAVGSNVRCVSTSPKGRERGLAVLFGLQRTRCRTLEVMQKQLSALARQGCVTKIIAVGTSSGAEATERERMLLASFNLTQGYEQRGATPEAELSDLLLSAQFGISDQDELSFTKSGTFMAYAAHGLNVISPAADEKRPEPVCWLTQPGELQQGIDSDKLRDRADRLREWQERTASWPQIATRFARALHVGAPVAAQT